MRKPLVVISVTALGLFAADTGPKFALTPEIHAALDSISPEVLRANLSFLASDLLEGRDTPSRGLDIAAEFIAAQFRRAGLEPAGDNGYFQTATLMLETPDPAGLSLLLSTERVEVSIGAGEAQVRNSQPLDLRNVPVFKLDLSDAAQVEALTPEQMDGKVVFTEFIRGAMERGRSALGKVRRAKPALTLMLQRNAGSDVGRSATQLVVPGERGSQSVTANISGAAAARFFDALEPGTASKATLTGHAAAPKQEPVILHNVVAIVRGSDPVLKDTCVLVSSHYDHIGIKPPGPGDRIFNGANDDGSGTVSVIEVASALAKLKQHPRRSIVFVTFFGEEKGGLGSRWYASHPVIPLAKTVADLNLEQLGRTDSTEGPQIANTAVTGYDYSNVVDALQEAGELTGIKIYKHPRNSDLYFGASDNVSLAEKGVPAHTLSVAYDFSDYHGVGDEWQKIDYANMAKVDRMVAASILILAGSPEAPHWNTSNPKTERYRQAR